MSPLDGGPRNQLLAALPASELAALEPHLRRVRLELGQILYESGERPKHAYFPASSIVSLHYITESGASAETAGVGNEGVVGVSLYMGGETVPGTAVVQTAGLAWQIDRRALVDAFERNGVFHRLLLRYAQALLTQVFQSAACNRHHSIEQQLCRWLLATLDRLPSNDLLMTQELVANMLGVRRESITEAAGALQRAGLVSYRRGHISVLARGGLEDRACECYRVIKNEVTRLMHYRPDLLGAVPSVPSSTLQIHRTRSVQVQPDSGGAP